MHRGRCKIAEFAGRVRFINHAAKPFDHRALDIWGTERQSIQRIAANSSHSAFEPWAATAATLRTWSVQDRRAKSRRARSSLAFLRRRTGRENSRCVPWRFFDMLWRHVGNVVESKEETMSREQSLRNGAGLMVLGALIFLVYAVVFFFRAFASSGFRNRCRDVERRYTAATRWA